MCANLTAPAPRCRTADTAAPGQTAITFTDMPSSPEFVESITWAGRKRYHHRHDVRRPVLAGLHLQYLADPHVHLARASARPVKTPSGCAGQQMVRTPPQCRLKERASSPATRCADAPTRHDRHLSLAARQFAVRVRRHSRHVKGTDVMLPRSRGAHRPASSQARTHRIFGRTTPASAPIP